MIRRRLAEVIAETCRYYPIASILGPRQSGKTTLARAVFADRPYRNLEEPATAAYARDDPRAFLRELPDGGVIDEIQRVPELTRWLQAEVDARDAVGRWILTGSHQPQLRESLSQSLAGRTAVLHLLPFSLMELAAYRRRIGLDEVLVGGCYPRCHEREIPPARFHADYLATYLERDVRQILELRDLAGFQRTLGLLAGRCGQILNYAGIAGDAGVDQNTVSAWCGVLETSFLGVALRPWFANVGKRLVKRPKWYYLDVGLAAHLMGITSVSHLAAHPLRGALFETLMISEAMKVVAHAGSPARLHFFRDARGNEIDLLVEAGGELLAVEIKAGRTVASDWFAPFEKLARLPGVRVGGRMVVYGGDELQARSAGAVVPWWRFGFDLCAWLAERDALPGGMPPPETAAALRAAFADHAAGHAG